ncbi:MAG: rhodanese-like domain-containing protein [Acidimicrobiales bacterium]
MTEIAEITVADAAGALDDGAVLLDVREPDEWEAGHAPGAVHVPLGDLPGRVGELDAGVPVVVICRSGARSARATAWLSAQGFGAANLVGGMQQWEAAGRPVTSAAGTPGRVV